MVVRGGTPGRRPPRPGVVTPGADAYSATGGAWQTGPGRIYDRLADVLLARAPVPLAGSRVLDVGAGTGAASRAALAAGAAAVVAVDAAFGMLAHGASSRPPAVVGDALALPVASGAVDAAVAAFSLNHVRDPAAGLGELARVTRPGGCVLASAYAADDTHPVKAAVEDALAERGWVPEPWYVAVREETAPALATVELAARAAADAGLEAEVDTVRVPFPELGAGDLVAWRLGLAQHAPFVSRLEPGARAAVEAEARARLGDAVPTLVRSMVVVVAVRA